jgi:hypothetical protein
LTFTLRPAACSICSQINWGFATSNVEGGAQPHVLSTSNARWLHKQQ